MEKKIVLYGSSDAVELVEDNCDFPFKDYEIAVIPKEDEYDSTYEIPDTEENRMIIQTLLEDYPDDFKVVE